MDEMKNQRVHIQKPTSNANYQWNGGMEEGEWSQKNSQRSHWARKLQSRSYHEVAEIKNVNQKNQKKNKNGSTWKAAKTENNSRGIHRISSIVWGVRMFGSMRATARATGWAWYLVHCVFGHGSHRLYHSRARWPGCAATTADNGAIASPRTSPSAATWTNCWWTATRRSTRTKGSWAAHGQRIRCQLNRCV